GTSDPSADRAVVAATLSELPSELALLQAAEARYPSLRRRHVEQLVLLGSVSRLMTAAAGLIEEASAGTIADAGAPGRMESIADLRTALAGRLRSRDEGDAAVRAPAPPRSSLDEAGPRPSSVSEPPPVDRDVAPGRVASAESARLTAHLVEMELAL